MRVFVLFTGILGVIIGSFVGWFVDPPALQLPMPHHVPKNPGGVSLRFAMVHDVIHERFPWHGKAYYQERNRLIQVALKNEEAGKPSEKYFALLDDLGVGMERLGRHQEAVDLMRNKLKKQQALGLKDRDLYSTYANLGTFLVLWQLEEGLKNVEAARNRLKESLEWIHKSIQVNPEAHFGREIWQAVILEFILANLDQSELLWKYDMVGNRLDSEIRFYGTRAAEKSEPRRNWINVMRRQSAANLDRTLNPQSRASLRGYITHVGAEKNWTEEVRSSHKHAVPFDEPMLGIVGMWRYGGGANPFFALALGETMARVGQRYIAWAAYERAVRLVPEDGPQAKTFEKFVVHCRNRQALIESTLAESERANLRPQFEKELAFGKGYQKAYQDYEARRIEEGADLDDPRFYDEFEAQHGPIATPVGPEDIYLVELPIYAFSKAMVGGAMAGAGVLAFLAALLLRATYRRPHRWRREFELP
jgi:hypothetical protein